MAMIIVLYMAVALAASTVVTSQAAVAGITLGVLWFAPMLGAFLPAGEIDVPGTQRRPVAWLDHRQQCALCQQLPEHRALVGAAMLKKIQFRTNE